MTKPVTIPNTFATATTAIPLSNLDADFSTVATALNDANTYSNYAPDTGSANAYVVTLSGVSTTYSAGLRIQFKAGNANTTASTLNVNGGGAKNITYQDATAIASGTIAANSIVDVMYDGTQFLLMNDPAGATGGDVVGPSSATDNAIVRFDGTTGKLVQNSVVTIADSTGDVSGVGQLNATTVDATNIEVTNIKAKDGTAAASIADSTGVISITSNPVLSGGTANGVLYLNGSKVATSGSALTFDGTNFATTGTASATKFIPTGGTATGNGMYLPTSNELAWSNNGSETMRLTSTGLGIGTSSPSNKLQVNGSIVDNASGSYTAFTPTGLGVLAGGYGANNTANLWLAGGVGNNGNQVGHYINSVMSGNGGGGGSAALQIGQIAWSGSAFTSGTAQITLDSSGNLGLGVTPSGWNVGRALQIGTSGDASLLGFANSVYLGANTYFNGGWYYTDTAAASRYQMTSGAHSWYTAPSGTAGNAITFTQSMTLDAGGNLGIGQTNPSSKLEVTGVVLSKAAGNAGRFDAQDTNSGGAIITINSALSSAGTPALQTQTNHPILFATNNTERARITSGGELLVGTTSASLSGATRTLALVSSGFAAAFQTTSSTATDEVLCLQQSATTGDNTFIVFKTEGGTGTGRGTITYNRGAGLTAYNTTSDYRAKDIIGPVQNPGATIDALKVYEGKMKGATQSRPMLIAHEAQEHAPYAVSGVKDEVNEDGTPKFQQMDVSSLVPLLLAEIQSLRQRVALLEGN